MLTSHWSHPKSEGAEVALVRRFRTFGNAGIPHDPEAALAIAIDFATIALKAHVQNAFFMNWRGQPHGKGYEFFILAVGIALALVIRGSGALSIERLLAKNADSPTPTNRV